MTVYLYEYEAIELFKRYKIPIEKTCLAKNYEGLKKCLYEIPPPNVLKAQVLSGKRGKSGGILFPNTKGEYLEYGKKLLGKDIAGMKVDSILVSERIDIKKEMYIAITIDKSKKKYVVIIAAVGGMDIEEIAMHSPHMIEKIIIDPLLGYSEYVIRRIAKKLMLPVNEVKKIFIPMYRLFIENKCLLVEINPLVLTTDGRLLAIDRKIIFDDSFIRLDKGLKKYIDLRMCKMSESEKIAYKHGFSYVKLNGNIAIIGNGAGLTMATMDLISLHGGKPGVFLDLGGGASSERVRNALLIVLHDKDIDKVFVNILGGITRCDEVAEGIVRAMEETKTDKKLFVRLVGNNEEVGRKILFDKGIYAFVDLEEAVKEVVMS